LNLSVLGSTFLVVLKFTAREFVLLYDKKAMLMDRVCPLFVCKKVFLQPLLQETRQQLHN